MTAAPAPPGQPRADPARLAGLAADLVFWLALAVALVAGTQAPEGPRMRGPAPAFYLLLCLAVASLGFKIALALATRRAEGARAGGAVALAQACLVFLVLVWIPALTPARFHGFFDFMYHGRIMEEIIATGTTLPPDTRFGPQYVHIPGFHLLGALVSLVLGLPVDRATALVAATSVGLVYPLATGLLAASLGRACGLRPSTALWAGALAALLCSTVRWSVFWGSVLATNTFGLGLALAILYAAYRGLLQHDAARGASLPWLALVSVLFAALVPSHIGATTIILVFMGITFAGYAPLLRVASRKAWKGVGAGAVLALCALMAVAWYMFYAAQRFDRLLFQQYTLIQTRLSGESRSILVRERSRLLHADNPFWADATRGLDLAVFALATLVLGLLVLVWVWRRTCQGRQAVLNWPVIAIAATPWIFFGFTLFGFFLKDVGLFGRWAAYGAAFLFVFLALAGQDVLRRAAGPRGGLMRPLAAALAVGLVLAGSAIGAMGNASADTHLVRQDLSAQPSRSFTTAELAGMEAIGRLLPNTTRVGSDPYASAWLAVEHGFRGHRLQLDRNESFVLPQPHLMLRIEENRERGLLANDPLARPVAFRLDVERQAAWPAQAVYDNGAVLLLRR